MSLVLFAPVSSHRPEVGIMLLMASQLAAAVGDAFVLRCNGFLSACDRDFEVATDSPRAVDQCMRCMREQRDFATALSLPMVELGSFVEPSDLEQIKLEQINGRARSRVDDAGYVSPIPANLLPERVRALRSESGIVLERATKKLFSEAKPKLFFVAGEPEFVPVIAANVANEAGSRVVVFAWNAPQSLVVIRVVGTDTVINCPFVVEDLSRVKVDPRSWPKELVGIFEQLKTALIESEDSQGQAQGA